MMAPGEDKDGGTGTRMMVDIAQKPTRPIIEDALAGVSLLLPAPRQHAQRQLPVPSWTTLGSPANAAATSRGWGGAPGAEKDPKRVQHGWVAICKKPSGLLAPSLADEGHQGPLGQGCPQKPYGHSSPPPAAFAGPAQASTAAQSFHHQHLDPASPTLLFLQLQAAWLFMPGSTDAKFASVQTRVPALPFFFF